MFAGGNFVVYLGAILAKLLLEITKHLLNLHSILVQKWEIPSNFKAYGFQDKDLILHVSSSLNFPKLFTFAYQQPQVLNSQNFKHKLLYYLKHNDSPRHSIYFPGSKTSDQLFSTANENANTFNKFHSNLVFLTFSDNNNLCIANVEIVARLPSGLHVAIITFLSANSLNSRSSFRSFYIKCFQPVPMSLSRISFTDIDL